jgi:homoserine dehydrogenase
MTALDRVGVLAQITSIFSQFSISIEALIQKEPPENVEKVTIVVLTHRVSEKSVNQAIAQIEQLEGIEGNVTRLRVETL